jgi:hypothetical protein
MTQSTGCHLALRRSRAAGHDRLFRRNGWMAPQDWVRPLAVDSTNVFFGY